MDEWRNMAISGPSRWLPRAGGALIFFLAIFAAPAIVMSVHDAPVRARADAAPALWRERLNRLLGKKRVDVIGALNSRYDVGYSLGDASQGLYPGAKQLTKIDHVYGLPLGETWAPPFIWDVGIDLTYDQQGRLVSYDVGVTQRM
jgi:hypothetical protein